MMPEGHIIQPSTANLLKSTEIINDASTSDR